MPDKETRTTRTDIVLSPELEAERAAILNLATQGDDAQWQLGAHYNRILDKHLAENSGFKHARDFFAHALKSIPQSTLSRDGAIARAFPEDFAKKYGASPLAALLTYEKLTDAKPTPGDPAEFPVAVPQPDGSTVNKRFADCSRAELNAAIHQLKQPPGSISKEDAEILERLQQGLEQEYGENPPIAMRSRTDRAGGTLVVLTVPIEHLQNLRDVLMKQFGTPAHRTGAFALGQTAAASVKAIGKLFGKKN